MSASRYSRSIGSAGRAPSALAQGLRQVLPANLGTGQGDRGGEHLLELTNVERPVVFEQHLGRLARKRSRRAALVVPPDQRGDEETQVLEALAQRRQTQLVAPQPGVQVVPELALLHQPAHIGRWWRPRPGRPRRWLGWPERQDLFLLQHAQQRRL